MTRPWTEFGEGLQALRERRIGGKLDFTVG
jgi:hypothetical protein